MAKKLYDEYEEEIELEDVAKTEDEEEVAEIHLPKEDKKDGEKKDHKWLNRILSLILGFFIGVFSVWGTIAAVACVIMFQPIDNTVNMVDTVVPGDLYATVFGEKGGKEGILDDKYAELKVKDLLGDSFGAIKQLASDDASLAPLNEISPKVGGALDSLIKGLDKYGIPLDRNKLLNAPFKQADNEEQSLINYFKSSFKETPAGDFFKALGSDMSPILMAICYGVENTDYIVNPDGTVTMLGDSKKTTIGDLLGDEMTDKFDDVLLCDALDVKADSNRILISIAYGDDYTIENGEIVCANPRTIGELRNSKGAFIDDIPLTSVLTEERSNGVTMYMLYGKKKIHYDVDADGNIQMLEQRLLLLKDSNNEYKAYNEYGEPLTKQQGVVGEDGYVAGYTLDFTNKLYVDANGHEYNFVNARTTYNTKDGVADVYYLRETTGDKVLYPVHDLGDLDGTDNLITRINSRLTLGELMDEKTINESKFLPHVTQYTIEELPKALNDLHLNDVYANEIYVNGKDATDGYNSAWRYLICTYDANGNLIEQDYTLNNLDPLIDNMKANIHCTTLNQLAEDGMINFSEDTLNQEIKTSIYSPKGGGYVDIELPFLQGKTTIGEFTLDEMIKYTDTIVQLI
ncbi:MAG: hypothetical protein IJX49_05315 [Clostridia bacterium]|nr:hypothetical protein [Clostridia bacterium]